MDQPSQYCRSFGYDQNVFDAFVKVKGKYNECYLGLLNWRGRATNTDWKYCTWRTYYPRLPIWKRTYKSDWDSKKEIISWKCNYDAFETDAYQEWEEEADERANDAEWASEEWGWDYYDNADGKIDAKGGDG